MMWVQIGSVIIGTEHYWHMTNSDMETYMEFLNLHPSLTEKEGTCSNVYDNVVLYIMLWYITRY